MRTVTIRCAEPGCREFSLREYANQRDYRDARAREYRCFRHAKPDELLTPDSQERVVSLVIEERNGRNYIGRSGIASGPGFRIIADDWPVGTQFVLAVRALASGQSGADLDTAQRALRPAPLSQERESNALTDKHKEQ